MIQLHLLNVADLKQKQKLSHEKTPLPDQTLSEQKTAPTTKHTPYRLSKLHPTKATGSMEAARKH
jgi:hypothetical protein